MARHVRGGSRSRIEAWLADTRVAGLPVVTRTLLIMGHELKLVSVRESPPLGLYL